MGEKVVMEPTGALAWSRDSQRKVNREEAEKVIARLWRGWTAPSDADTYEELLKREILPGIEKQASGYNGVQVMRRDDTDRVEFVTLTLWDSVGAIRQFIGDDYEVAYVPAEAKRLLASYDRRSIHYQLVLSVP